MKKPIPNHNNPLLQPISETLLGSPESLLKNEPLSPNLEGNGTQPQIDILKELENNSAKLSGKTEVPLSNKTQFQGKLMQQSQTQDTQASRVLELEQTNDELTAVLNEEDRYEILKQLGEGGMGVVELVKDRLLGREVARKTIKVNKKNLQSLDTKQKILLLRLKKEATITAVLEHPNIIPLYEMQQKPSGEIQFTMRKVEGETLRHLMLKKRTDPRDEAENRFLNIFLKVCDAIGYAHSKRVIHRDLKPDNIMVGAFGEVYVMDWGIAKQLGEETLEDTSFQEAPEPSTPPKTARNNAAKEAKVDLRTIGGMGTQGYMPPEQAEDASKVTPASDIFAMGKILKECFTLTSPQEEFKLELERFQRTQKQGSSKKSNSGTFETELDKKIPLEIRAIIKKATEELPEHRYQSLSEFVHDLENYQKNLKVSAKEYGLLETLIKWSKRNRQFLAILMVLFVVSGSIIGFFQWKEWSKTKAILAQKEIDFAKAQTKAQEFWSEQKKNEQKKITTGKSEKKTQQELQDEIDILLKAMTFLNEALLLKPNHPEIENHKWTIGNKILKLCFQSKDYSLASFVAQEIDKLPRPPEDQTLNPIEQVKEERSLLLEDNKKRLKYWKEELNKADLKMGMRENAIFEISKMSEKEIFDELINILKEGATYFLSNEEKTPRRSEYFGTMAIALGRLENSDAAEPLLEALENFNNQKFQNPKFELQLQHMVNLSEALSFTKAQNIGYRFLNLLEIFDRNQAFWIKTEHLHSILFPTEIDLTLLSSNDSALYQKQGLLKIFKNKYEEALIALDRAIELDPENHHAYKDRGNAKLHLGDIEGSIQDSSKAIQLRSTFAAAYCNRGDAKAQKRDFEGALQDYDMAVQLDPYHYTFYENRGITKDQKGDFEGALADFNYILSQDPKFPRIHLRLAWTKHQKKNFKEALNAIDQAIIFNSQDWYSYQLRAFIKRDMNDVKGAIEDINQAISLNPSSSDNYRFRGDIKFNQKNYEGAIQDYTQAIAINPKDTKIYDNRAVANERKLNYEGAISDYDEILKINPNDAKTYHNRGIAKKNKNDLRGAFQDYNKTIELSPEFPNTYYNRGIIYEKFKKLEEAKVDYQLFLKLTQQSKDPFYDYFRNDILTRFPELTTQDEK